MPIAVRMPLAAADPRDGPTPIAGPRTIPGDRTTRAGRAAARTRAVVRAARPAGRPAATRLEPTPASPTPGTPGWRPIRGWRGTRGCRPGRDTNRTPGCRPTHGFGPTRVTGQTPGSDRPHGARTAGRQSAAGRTIPGQAQCSRPPTCPAGRDRCGRSKRRTPRTRADDRNCCRTPLIRFPVPNRRAPRDSRSPPRTRPSQGATRPRQPAAPSHPCDRSQVRLRPPGRLPRARYHPARCHPARCHPGRPCRARRQVSATPPLPSPGRLSRRAGPARTPGPCTCRRRRRCPSGP